MSLQNLLNPNTYKLYLNELINSGNIIIITTNPTANILIENNNTVSGNNPQTSSIIGFNNTVSFGENSGAFGDDNQVLGSSFWAYCFGSDNTIGTSSFQANQSIVMSHNSSTTASNSIVIGNSVANT